MGKLSGMPLDTLGQQSPSASPALSVEFYWTIAIDLVGGHVNQWRFRQNERAACSRFKVPTAFVSKSSNGFRRPDRGMLRRRVDNGLGAQQFHNIRNALAVAHVQFMVGKAF